MHAQVQPAEEHWLEDNTSRDATLATSACRVTALAMGTQPTVGTHNLKTYIIVIQDKTTESLKQRSKSKLNGYFS